MDSREQEIVNSYACGFINVVDDWIYYSRVGNDQSYNLHKVKVDGSGDKKLNEDKSYYNNVVGDWMYYSDFGDGILPDMKINRVKIDGSGR